MAVEALRIAAWRPRLGFETDDKTIPHELDLLRTAVHLTKGCYKGQETVARVHNLGHPPRRLVFLHLDGSLHTLPAPGSDVVLGEKTVGRITSAALHHEAGPIALADHQAQRRSRRHAGRRGRGGALRGRPRGDRCARRRPGRRPPAGFPPQPLAHGDPWPLSCRDPAAPRWVADQKRVSPMLAAVNEPASTNPSVCAVRCAARLLTPARHWGMRPCVSASSIATAVMSERPGRAGASRAR